MDTNHWESNPENESYIQAIYLASLLYKLQEQEPLTAEEAAALEQWRGENTAHARLIEKLKDRRQAWKELEALQQFDTQEAVREIFAQLEMAPVADQEQEAPAGRENRRSVPLLRMLAAAAVLLLALSGVWLLIRKPSAPGPQTLLVGHYHNDVLPGNNAAILTLADGSTIPLDSLHSGELAQVGATRIVNQNGELRYQGSATTGRQQPGGGQDVSTGFNSIATPIGRKYQLLLPDGSKVWLNAGSSLRYPTSFTGGKRLVELTGEAYFEVAKNPASSFVVKTGGMEVVVLGTHFDVMAYTDEPSVRTILSSGAVRVSAGGKSTALRPGQAIAWNAHTGLQAAVKVDTTEAMAWKEGLFRFNGTDIQTIMREVARWYGVEIVYRDRITEEFVAEIPRTVPLSGLLSLLESTRQVHFQIEGRTITVTK